MTARDNTTTYNVGEYDSGVLKTIPYYDFIRQEVFDFVRSVVDEPPEWLDTGCGTGTLALEAIQRFPGARFTLSDPSEAMLDEARTKLGAEGARVHILPPAGSAQLPRDLDGRFDVVTAILCHHYLQREERREAVAACLRMLKPGGFFLAFEIILPSSERGLELGKRRWLDFQTRQGKSEAEARVPIERLGRHSFPVTVREHLELLHTSGFADADLLWCAHMQAGFWAVR